MDIHERFMSLSTAPILMIIQPFNEKPLNTVDEYAAVSKLKSKFASMINLAGKANTEQLQQYRMTLIQLYRIKFHFSKKEDIFSNENFQNIYYSSLTLLNPDDFPLLRDIIVLQLVLLNDELMIIEEYKSYQRNFQDLAQDKVARIRYIKTIDSFLDAWQLLHFLNKSSYSHTSAEFMALLIENDLTTWLISEEDPDRCHLGPILPKLVELGQSATILKPLWEEVHKLNDLKDKLTAMCLLVHSTFPLKASKLKFVEYSTCLDRRIWTSIIAGLTAPQQMLRKTAMFLMKKITEFIDENENAIKETEMFDNIEFTPFICKQADSSSIRDIRNKFILLMEVLEEKQRHLIVPSLSLLEVLQDGNETHKVCGNCFNLCWIQCFFQRINHHDNNSIARWGMIHALKSDYANDDEFLKMLVTALNNTCLYERKSDEKEPAVVIELLNLFVRAENQKIRLIPKFISIINDINWAPVPLCYVIKALVGTSRLSIIHNYWGEDELIAIQHLASTQLQYHPRQIKNCTMFNLLLVPTLYVQQRVDLLFLTKFFELPWPKSMLEDNKMLTDLLAKWLTRITTKEDAVMYIKQVCTSLLTVDNYSLKMSAIAFMICLLYYSKVLQVSRTCPASVELARLCLSLDGIDVRPYMNTSLTMQIIELIICIYDYPQECNSLIKYLPVQTLTICQYLIKSLFKPNFDGNHVKVCIKALEVLKYPISLDDIDMQKKCLSVFENAKECNGSLLYIVLFLKTFSNGTGEFVANNIKIILDTLTLKKPEHGDCATEDNKIISEYYFVLLNVLSAYFRHILKNVKENIDWLKLMLFFLDTNGNDAVSAVAKILSIYLIEMPLESEQLQDFENVMVKCYECNLKSPRNLSFWYAADSVATYFSEDVFFEHNSIRECTKKLIHRLLEEGETSPGLKYLLLSRLYKPKYFSFFKEVIVDCLLHGPILRADQKTNMDAITFGKWATQMKTPTIENADVVNCTYNSATIIRAAAVKCLYAANSVRENDMSSLLPLLTSKLIDIKGKRYYADSQLHRLKHRIMQALLLLQPFLSKRCTGFLHDFLCSLLLSDSDQYSVRIMIEWLLMLIYVSNINHDFLNDRLWACFKTVCEKRPASAHSVISILYHVVVCIGSPEIIEKALTVLAPCCMGQQFTMRLYAQAVFTKLYRMLSDDYSKKSEFTFLFNTALESLRQGMSKKNAIDLDLDFYLTTFHPKYYYNIETIYQELPRLCNVGCDEWVSVSTFTEESKVPYKNISIPLKSTEFTLCEVAVPSYMAKQAKTEAIGTNDLLEDIQKKIIPLKMSGNNGENYAQLSRSNVPHNSDTPINAEEIMVVASLVNRPQNLGGITRTCEIFGVRELIVSNLAVLQDKEFQCLSVTAEKWLNIKEIKLDGLKTYLTEMKEEGWSLVGAEQTVNSVSLKEVKFPKKTLLLLGNEKEGIPADLIPMMDLCVEVPQVGIIRSLNVHVTSALCIWEYRRQLQ